MTPPFEPPNTSLDTVAVTRLRLVAHAGAWVLAAASVYIGTIWVGLEGRRRWVEWGFANGGSNPAWRAAFAALRHQLSALTLLTALASLLLALLVFRAERRPVRWMTLVVAGLAVLWFLFLYVNVASS